MLSQEEQAFIAYWEANRLHLQKFSTRIKGGLPLGLRFALPIVVISIIARMTDFHKRNLKITVGTIIAVALAVMVIAIFYSVFSKSHQWDINEQYYRQLKSKQAAAEAV
jgi:predicted branched-subunit amino acid permease